MGDTDDDEGEVDEIDKTTKIMAAGDIWSFRTDRSLSLFLNITLPSPYLQTKGIVQSLLLSGQPFPSINWTRVRRKFFAAKAAPFRTYDSSEINESSPLSSLPRSPHSFNFPTLEREGGVPQRTVLSDERDKWQRCFGSGASKNRACTCASVYKCVLVGQQRQGV